MCDEDDGLAAIAEGTNDGVGKEGLSDVCVDCSRMNTLSILTICANTHQPRVGRRR